MPLPNLNLPADCQHVWVAVSGGVDSIVLLHWAAQNSRALAAQGIELKAIHINHQLSAQSDAWQQHVMRVCADWGVPLIVRRVDVMVRGQGLEHAARKARYQAFEAELAAGDVLMLGHHQDDQAETFLLRLMRGAGVQGLAAMSSVRTLGHAQLWRPFLNTPKNTLLSYAATHALRWVTDESNSDPRFDRNLLRRDVLPVLHQRWPHAAHKIAQAAEHALEAQQLLNEYAAADLAQLGVRAEKFGCSLCLHQLQLLSPPRQKQVVRYWLRGLGYLAPEAKHLDELQKVLTAKNDSVPALWVADYGFSRFAGRLYLLPWALTAETSKTIEWQGEALLLSDGSRLQIAGCSAPLSVRFRVGGERARPQGRGHSQVLKKLLQEYRVPPWLRYQVPLIYRGENLIAVGDYWLEEGVSKDVVVSWCYPSMAGR